MTRQKLSKDLIFFSHYASDLMNFAEKTNDALVANLRQLGEEHAEKNGGWDQHSFWYGAKIDIRDVSAPDAEACGYSLPDVTLKVDDPALVSGMFIKLTEFWPSDNQSGFDHIGKLKFYAKAAHLAEEEQLMRQNYNDKFVQFFFRSLALTLTKIEGQIELLLQQSDHTKFTCESPKKIKSLKDTYCFYFAYGSNMDPVQMHDRCPGAKPIGVAKYDDYQLMINTRGVATVVPRNDNVCYGVLWAVTEEHMRALDRYEGVKQGFYTKGLAKVYIHGTEFESVIYVASDSKPGVPRSGYLDKLIAGVEFFHGHDEWIEEIADFDNIIYMEA